LDCPLRRWPLPALRRKPHRTSWRPSAGASDREGRGLAHTAPGALRPGRRRRVSRQCGKVHRKDRRRGQGRFRRLRLQILRRITLPLAVPGLISAGIFSFTLSWNEFIYALAFIQSSANKTVPVAILTELVSGDVYQWGALMAGSLLGSLPVAVFYSLFVD
jgi:hypothetical protein